MEWGGENVFPMPLSIPALAAGSQGPRAPEDFLLGTPLSRMVLEGESLQAKEPEALGISNK